MSSTDTNSWPQWGFTGFLLKVSSRIFGFDESAAANRIRNIRDYKYIDFHRALASVHNISTAVRTRNFHQIGLFDIPNIIFHGFVASFIPVFFFAGLYHSGAIAEAKKGIKFFSIGARNVFTALRIGNLGLVTKTDADHFIFPSLKAVACVSLVALSSRLLPAAPELTEEEKENMIFIDGY